MKSKLLFPKYHPPQKGKKAKKNKDTKKYRAWKTRSLINSLDGWHSMAVRLERADASGMAKCYTCETRKHYKQMDCGHFAGRGHYNTRWMFENTKAQCGGCNSYNEGRKNIYAEELVREYGEGVIQKINTAARVIAKPNIDELLAMIEDRKARVRELLKGLEAPINANIIKN